MVEYGVSVVTTTYNERAYVKPFVERVRKVLSGIDHEIIIVDDNSPDGTYVLAREYADRALLKKREGQTKGLLYGIRTAKYPIVVTLDVDLENPPELIPVLVKVFLEKNYDLLVASRTVLPRFSERLASRVLGRIIGVHDIFSNYRVYKRDLFIDMNPRFGETFGAEMLVYAKKRGYRIGEYFYNPPPRRKNPRIGGRVRANIRILYALLKTLLLALS
ncbi:glycosyltransferase [Desulfurococcaceae archaeon MEX13E-LK6-19]|nr:glycosyltransferase [Desulfurococcaceae archaeon MEX13E-LK6-19]